MGVATSIPSSFVAGTTVKWTSTYADYPADDGWTLTLFLNGAANVLGAGGVGKAATPNGKAFDFTLATGDTNGWAAGIYHWEERASKGAEEYPVASGQIDILLNLKSAAAGAARTTDEKALAAIEAYLADPANAPTAIRSYQIAGRSIERWSRVELIGWRSYYEARIAAAKRGAGKFTTPIRVKFGSGA